MGRPIAVHRDVSISVDPGATDELLDALSGLDDVVTLSVQRGESIKPPGDIITATVLNVGVDDVLRAAQSAESAGPVSMRISSVSALLDTETQPQIRDDHDDVAWEEAETELRRHTRLNLNFALTTFAGGILAVIALISSSSVTAATALVAGGIIAPVLQPPARIAIALISRHRRPLPRALLATVASLALIVLAGLLTMLVFRAGGHRFVDDFLSSRTQAEIAHPPLINLILSACGAVAGAVVIAAGRWSSLAGALVALQMLPAAAAAGVAIELGDGTMALRDTSRMGIDLGMVLVACLIVFAYKQRFVHGGRIPPR